MDRELKEFIEDTVNSLSNLALLLFFYHNPGLCDTARGLSLKSGLSQEEIESC